MPYTPLVPLPDDVKSSNPDPFDELLGNVASTSPSSSNIKPLFPRHIPRKSSRSVKIARTSSETSSSGSPASLSMVRQLSSSTDSDFGAFVSVSPSQDPLANNEPSSFDFPSPGRGVSTDGDADLPSQNTAFVEDARRRAHENEQRILNEFLLDPINVHSDAEATQKIEFSVPEQQLQTVRDTAGAFVAFDELHTDNDLEFIASPEAPRSGMATPKAAVPPRMEALHSPVMTRSPSPQSLTNGGLAFIPPSLLEDDDGEFGDFSSAPMSNSAPEMHSPAETQPPISASMSASFSSTLSRTWSNLMLGSSSSHTNARPPLPTFERSPSRERGHAPHSPTSAPLPSASHGVSIPASYHQKEITHDSPFATQLFTPPSGAPGFTGDRNWNKKGFEFSSEQKSGNPIKLSGRNESARPILTDEIVDSIRPHMPPLFRLSSKWTLLYSLDQHGISLATLYSRTMPQANVTSCLIVIKDAENRRFGVWVGDGIKKSTGQSYYGSGESFLWKEDLPAEGHEQHERGRHQVRVFKWTAKNDYVALCESEYISFGGGEGHYGLFLDSTLYDGSSARCPTFDNEPLCGSSNVEGTVRFECVGLEAWSIPR